MSSCLRWIAMALAVGLGAASRAKSENVFPGNAWQEATPESQGVDSVKLEAAADSLGVKQLVIVRNGYLIWKGSEADSCHVIHSCTKVFTSTCLGLVLDDGKCQLDDLMVKYLPDWDDEYPVYAKVTLRHLALMMGGTKGKLGYVGPWQRHGDPVVYATTPDKPEFAPSGSQVA